MRKDKIFIKMKTVKKCCFFVFVYVSVIQLPLFASFKVFVFNPESQISRGRYIKHIFENACKKARVSCAMQIFAKSVDFERVMKVRKPEFAIVASYYYTLRKKKFRWSPIFSGYRAGASGFKKALLSTKGKKLKNIKYISAIAVGGNSINPVEQKFINSVGKGTFFVTKVSKEIDAIMGLALAQVDGAIVTTKTLNILGRVNPKARRSLRTIKILPIIKYPKIVKFPTVAKRKLQEIKVVLSILSKNLKKTRLFFRYFGVTKFK